MAFSSFPYTPELKYDVFLSFRGVDTGNNFASHLHASLYREEIESLIVNEDEEEFIGESEISPSRLSAIEESRISVVIFSKGYASSKWCVEELVQIIECSEKYGHFVIPVFYHVDPSHVRNQIGNFEDGRVSEEKLQKVKRWFMEADNLSCLDSNDFRCESVLVEEIVKCVLKRLNDMYPSDEKDVVGVQSRMKKIESLLQVGSKDVRIVGILGIGGIGKTTIARAVYDNIRSQFEDSYFALNVREALEIPNGLTTLRQELLSTILNDGLSNIGFNFLEQRLGRKNVLIVFDDVISLEQIAFLIGDLNSLGQGSRVIITTRDKKVLTNCGVDEENIYEVEALFHHEALQLFSWYAFQQSRPTLGYNELSSKILKYAKGIPFSLKVLGSSLLRQIEVVWESIVNELERISNKDIHKVLKVSYDRLDDDEKNIFLDIVCFLKGESREFVVRFLDVSGFFAEIGMSILIDKCLIFESNNKITMHNLLQEMGWEIVRQESFKGLGGRSRLWHHEDIYHVLKENMGTKAIQGICLDMSKIRDIHLSPQDFSMMHNLRFLKLYNSYCEEKNINKVHVRKSLESVFSELRYLCWHGCPLNSLQSNFHLENLVALDMLHSNIGELWAGAQDLANLKSINLSHSKHLIESPDFSCTPNLERLILEGCTSLLEISSSIRCLNKLVFLNLGHCKSLPSLPSCIHLKSLRKVILSCCLNLEMFPEISCNVEELLLDGTAIEELPLSIENLSRLAFLNLENCSRLKRLPSNICKLKSLEHLILSGCSDLDGLPANLGQLEGLKVLKAERVSKREVPSSIVHLSFLVELNLTDCYIMELPNSLGRLSLLKSLHLGGNNFESIPASIIDLSMLSCLDLGGCERLRTLPELPCNLQYIDAHNCILLAASSSLSNLFSTIPRRTEVNFINCFKLDQRALKNTIKDLLRKIQHLKMEFNPRPSAYICFPGTEIPEWFTFHGKGSYLSLKLPLGLFDPRLVTLATCAIVEFQNYHDKGQGLVVSCDCKIRSNDGEVLLYHGTLRGWYHCNGPYSVHSHHIFMGYDFHLCSFDFVDYECDHSYEVSIHFYVEDLNIKRIDCCEVRSCGVYLLFSHKFSVPGVIDNKIGVLEKHQKICK